MCIRTDIFMGIHFYMYVYIYKETKQSTLPDFLYCESSLFVWIIDLEPKIMIRGYFH